MKTPNYFMFQIMLFVLVFFSSSVFSQELKQITLPAPQTKGGKPFMTSLKERKTTRSFSDKSLSRQMVSNLLWAACGINRPDSGKRTAPSAHNRQEIDIYLADANGLYLYDAGSHLLKPVLSQDIRELTGKQKFVKTAPINLIYIVNFSKMGDAKEEDKIFYSAVDTGFISQNVYLFCASEDLATVVRGWVDKPALAKAMNLKPDQKVILAQTVGYPEDKK